MCHGIRCRKILCNYYMEGVTSLNLFITMQSSIATHFFNQWLQLTARTHGQNSVAYRQHKEGTNMPFDVTLHPQVVVLIYEVVIP